MIKTVIFDLDGTLTDSFDGIVDSFNHALAVNGYEEADREAVRRLIGVPLEGMLARLQDTMTTEEIDRVSKSYREHYIGVCGEKSPLFPDVLEALDLLKDKRLICASTKYTPQVKVVLETQGITDRFILMQGSEDIPKKPAPDLFLKALGIAGGEPETTAAVGDSTMDIEAALASGCLPIGVLTGIGTKETLEGAGCRNVFPNLSSAAAFLAKK